MSISSAYKILYLMNLVSKKAFSKRELMQEFLKNGIKVSKQSINNYLKILMNNGIDIKISRKKNLNIYYIEQEQKQLELTEQDVAIIRDIKKLLFVQKNYNRIRKTVRLFYKLALLTKGNEMINEMINFGYFSSINWYLVRTLEKHCRTKDILKIDYILPGGGNKKIIIHVDDLRISEWSDRLYLWGALYDAPQLSYLPVDRIFMVEKIIRKAAPFHIPINIVMYKISRNLYDEIELEAKEELVDLDENYAVIQRPIVDEFFLVQRLMSFCPDLYYISDARIRNKVKEKLEMLRASYEKEFN